MRIMTKVNVLVLVALGAVVIVGGWLIFRGSEVANAPSERGGNVADAAFCGISTFGACAADSDCTVTGCSSQVCQSADEGEQITTCEWRACYDAAAYGLSCRCAGKTCQWAP